MCVIWPLLLASFAFSEHSLRANRDSPVIITPQFSRAPAHVCDGLNADGVAWYADRVEGETFATYEWGVESSGCYLLEILYPQTCPDISYSTAVPAQLTYFGDQRWTSFFNQTYDSPSWMRVGHFMFMGGHPGILSLGGESPEHIDVDDPRLKWIAPHVRVSWWNSECSEMESENSVDEEGEIEVLQDVPASIDRTQPHTEHWNTFRESGCYLLEAKFTQSNTKMLFVHGQLRSKVVSSPYPGNWEGLTVHKFDTGDQLFVMTNEVSHFRVTFVGSVCRTWRKVTVKVTGVFAENSTEYILRHVVQNVADEAKVDPIRVLKRGIAHAERGRMHIYLYTFGIYQYRARSLCNLVGDDIPCTARVIWEQIQYPLQFVDPSWVYQFETPFYILCAITCGVVICTCCIRLVCTCTDHCHRRRVDRRNTSVWPTGSHECVISIVGRVVDKDGSLFEQQPDRFRDCERGWTQYVIGRPPCPPRADEPV